MKKKGLIISTIVMVVVLVASLTTATYAWFTSTATATISSMRIQTTASEGLQIAAAVRGNSTLQYYNGSVQLGENAKKWAQYSSGDTLAEESGFGSELTLTSTGTNLISNMYGASGSGLQNAMFVQSNSAKLISETNPVVLATENVSYLALDFAITATANGTAYINQIYVDPTIVSGKSGMAGSMRIALFATEPGAALTDLPTWTIADHGHMLYEPYGEFKYSGAAFSSTAETNNYYTAAGHTVVYFDEVESSTPEAETGATLKTTYTKIGDANFEDAKYYITTETPADAEVVAHLTAQTTGAGTLSESTLQTLWTGKVVYGDGASATGKTLTAAGNSAVYANLTAAQAKIKAGLTDKASLGEVTTGDIIYLRLVVWFDGESKACNQEFAGGGANVQINFSLQPEE